MTTIRAFFLEIRALFSNFRKRAGETSPLPPPLVTRLRMLDPTHKKKMLMQYLKIASLSTRMNKIPNTLLLVQS